MMLRRNLDSRSCADGYRDGFRLRANAESEIAAEQPQFRVG